MKVFIPEDGLDRGQVGNVLVHIYNGGLKESDLTRLCSKEEIAKYLLQVLNCR